MQWLFYLFIFVVLFLFLLRIVLIAYAKSIPRLPDQEPHVIDLNDTDNKAYHRSPQWLTFQAKCISLSTTSKQSAETRMHKKNTNTFRKKDITKKNRLNFNVLKNVIGIHIDPKGDNSYADVEGSITFESYVLSILPFGYIPSVIPELKSITVGGTIVGIGIESTSYKFGLVHESMIECDLLLANGDIVTCNNNPDNPHRDLFRAIPNSLGSLGYILRARMKILKAKPFVAIRNIYCGTYDILGERICSECTADKELDFIDGVAYWNGTGRIMVANMLDALPKSKRLTEYNVFHRFIEEGAKDKEEILYMRMFDYLFRWDEDMFWTIKNIWALNNKWIRMYLSKHVMRSDVLRHLHHVIFKRDIVEGKPHEVKAGNNMFINDVLVPEPHVKGFLKFWFEEVLYIRTKPQVRLPMYLCPVKGNEKDYSFLKLNEKVMNVNFGFWSTVMWDKKDIKLCAFVENHLEKYKAVKWLYGTFAYEKEKFYEIYDQDNVYFDLKKKYDKDCKIRHYYDKCKK